MTTIIVTHENNDTDEFVFDSSKSAITLGRRSSNDVCIPDLSVSGTHATLSLNDGETILEDLSSTNGSYVNGSVVQRTVVNQDDEIILGKILINFVLDAASENANKGSAPISMDATYDDVPDAPVTDSQQPRKTAQASGFASGAASAIHQTSVSGNDAMNESEIESIEPWQADSNAPERRGNSNGVQSKASEDSDVATVMRPKTATEANTPEQPNGKAHPLDGIEHLVVPTAQSDATPMHELDTPSSASKGAVIEIKNGAKSGQILPIDKPVTTLGRPGIQIAAIMRKPDGYFLMHIESDGTVDRPTLNSDSVGDEPVLLHSGDELTVAGIDVEFMLS